MITVKIKVTETEVTVEEKSGKLVSGNIEQIKCIFDLAPEFSGLIARACFNGVYVPVVNGECFAPELDEGRCKIGVYGFKFENNELRKRISPVECEEYVFKGSYEKSQIQAAEPKQTELEKIYELIQNLSVNGGSSQGVDVPDTFKGFVKIDTVDEAYSWFADVGENLNTLGENEFVVAFLPESIQLTDEMTSGLYFVFKSRDNIYIPDLSFLEEVATELFDELESHISNAVLCFEQLQSLMELRYSQNKSKIEAVEGIAKGKSQAIVFDTEADMFAWIRGELERPDRVPYDYSENHPLGMNIGDNIYIKDIGVPDYWWAGRNENNLETSVSELETQGVDLTDYPTTEYMNTAIATALSSLVDGDNLVYGEVTENE